MIRITWRPMNLRVVIGGWINQYRGLSAHSHDAGTGTANAMKSAIVRGLTHCVFAFPDDHNTVLVVKMMTKQIHGSTVAMMAYSARKPVLPALRKKMSSQCTISFCQTYTVGPHNSD